MRRSINPQSREDPADEDAAFDFLMRSRRYQGRDEDDSDGESVVSHIDKFLHQAKQEIQKDLISLDGDDDDSSTHYFEDDDDSTLFTAETDFSLSDHPERSRQQQYFYVPTQSRKSPTSDRYAINFDDNSILTKNSNYSKSTHLGIEYTIDELACLMAQESHPSFTYVGKNSQPDKESLLESLSSTFGEIQGNDDDTHLESLLTEPSAFLISEDPSAIASKLSISIQQHQETFQKKDQVMDQIREAALLIISRRMQERQGKSYGKRMSRFQIQKQALALPPSGIDMDNLISTCLLSETLVPKQSNPPNKSLNDSLSSSTLSSCERSRTLVKQVQARRMARSLLLTSPDSYPDISTSVNSQSSLQNDGDALHDILTRQSPPSSTENNECGIFRRNNPLSSEETTYSITGTSKARFQELRSKFMPKQETYQQLDYKSFETSKATDKSFVDNLDSSGMLQTMVPASMSSPLSPLVHMKDFSNTATPRILLSSSAETTTPNVKKKDIRVSFSNEKSKLRKYMNGTEIITPKDHSISSSSKKIMVIKTRTSQPNTAEEDAMFDELVQRKSTQKQPRQDVFSKNNISAVATPTSVLDYHFLSNRGGWIVNEDDDSTIDPMDLSVM
jgi:hypothetical protein